MEERTVSGFHLVCAKCANRCAVDAKFCAKCGTKLTQNAFGAMRTKLPSLDMLPPSTASSLTTPAPKRPTISHASQAHISVPSIRKKRSLPQTKKPVRIAKLALDTPSSPSQHLAAAYERAEQPSQIEETEELRLKIWMVSTRRLFESVLALKRRLDRPELEALDGARFESIDSVIHGLQHDLDTLDPSFALDRNLQAKCVAMLTKLKTLHRATQDRLSASIDSLETAQTLEDRSTPTADNCEHGIRDAEVVIRGPDGKKMFFKARRRPPTRSPSPEEESHPRQTPFQQVHVSALITPRAPPTTGARAATDPCKGGDISTCTARSEPERRTTAQFIRSRWPELLLFRVARVDGRAVLLRLQENDGLNQLVIDVYRPLTSAAVVVTIPHEWLSFILPASVAWYRVSEVRRYKAVEAHWGRCFDHVVRCLKWQPGNGVQVCFPIQFRQARMFTFRSFAVFYGLLSIQLLPAEYTLRISFLNAHTGQRVALSLPEREITRCLGGDSYRERMVGATTRKTLYAQVCERLYFEYTSRGFELLFPGVKPKGVVRRHPLEATIVLHGASQLEQERRECQALMSQCIRQVVVLARRRLELYHDRARRQKKQKQEAAVRKIQARTRGLVAKKKMRHQREEQRRTSRIQDLAAVLIQQKFRRRREAERQRHARALQLRETSGLRFRLACRISATFVLAAVTLDEIDAAANAFDCSVRVVHPSTFQAAQLRVAYGDLLRLTGRSCLHGWARSAVVETLLTRHLDVFRSVKHDVLVLALRNVAI